MTDRSKPPVLIDSQTNRGALSAVLDTLAKELGLALDAVLDVTLSGTTATVTYSLTATTERRKPDAFIWAHPGRMTGSPCVGQTRITCDTVAGMSLDEAIEGYDLTAEEYHLARWFHTVYRYEYSHDANQAFKAAMEEAQP